MKPLIDKIYENLIRKLIEEQLGEVYPKNFDDVYHPESISDHLLENLNTHDRKFLIRKLEELFDKEHIDAEIRPNTKDNLYIEVQDELDEEIKAEVDRLIEFYGYYITQTLYRYNIIYIVQPKNSKDCTDFVYDDCRGVCFHITTNKNVDSILKKGLRCKNTEERDMNRRYRIFPERVHVLAFPIKDIRNLKTLMFDVLRDLRWNNLENLTLLRIDIPNSNFSGRLHFYRDDAMHTDYTFFTYNNIPPQWIKKINTLDEFIG